MAEKKTKTTESKKVESINLSDFVIVDVNGSQEKMSEGEVLEVAKMDGKAKDKVKLDRVLLSFVGGKPVVGKPTIEGASVEIELVKQTHAEKVHTRTYKAKSRHRRHVGNRQDLTQIKVLKIIL